MKAAPNGFPLLRHCGGAFSEGEGRVGERRDFLLVACTSRAIVQCCPCFPDDPSPVLSSRNVARLFCNWMWRWWVTRREIVYDEGELGKL